MLTYQSEKKQALGARREALVQKNSSVSPLTTSAQRLAPSAFTLTELLVVITIITILASLITVAAVNAMRRSREARTTLEINQLHLSMEDLQNDLASYPPNGMNTGGTNYLGNNISQLVVSDFERSFRRAFPRINQQEIEVVRRLAGVGSDPLVGGMTGAEAIYFWLGGFSSDPEYPLSGPGGPSFWPGDPSGMGEILEDRNHRYEFDLGRLGPRTADRTFDGTNGRFIEYQVTYNGVVGQTRRINFWQYYPAGSEVPYVYFDASRHDPVAYDLPMSQDLPLYGIKRLREGAQPTTTNQRDIIFVNKNKFQILHAGLDDEWGQDFARFALDSEPRLLFPTGPFVGDIADTLTNFTTGTLESAQE